jgi:hypothetical protein
VVTVKVITSNSHIWNFGEVVEAITIAKNHKQDLVLDLNSEGPDFETLGLLEYIDYWDFRTTVLTRNAVQTPVKNIKFKNFYPHFFDTTQNALKDVSIIKQIEKPIGIFIGRSNPHRLYLSSYLYQHNLANQTFHYDSSNDFYRNNLGLDQYTDIYGVDALSQAVYLLSNSPIVKNGKLDRPLPLEDTYNFYNEYSNFLIEIVCETYYSGNTFFPTEKTWRPIMLETPFIVQGPQWYLHRLKDLGFQTFDRWWDEGYSEDPADYQPYEIVKVIDYLKTKTIKELHIIYEEMMPILKHNKKRFMELTKKDFEILKNDSR